MQVHSPAQLKGELLRADDRIVVLMCKAQSCRPCKVHTCSQPPKRLMHAASSAADTLVPASTFLRIPGVDGLCQDFCSGALLKMDCNFGNWRWMHEECWRADSAYVAADVLKEVPAHRSRLYEQGRSLPGNPW